MKKISALILTVFLLFIFSFSFFVGKTLAVSPVPPPGRIPCNAPGKATEFNSDRPYQASPCGDSPKAIWCGNTLQVEASTPSKTVDGVVSSLSGNPLFTLFPNGQTFAFDLSGAQFPIEGNTELTTNSQSSSDIPDSQKVNEYLSWYLGGVNNRAEFGSSKNTADSLVNFSGPVQKLLPSVIQDAQRLDTIATATKVVSYTNEDGKNVTENATHNQIVVCANNKNDWFLSGILNIFNLGRYEPTPCYNGDNTPAHGDKVLRLKDWNTTLDFNLLTNSVVTGAIESLKITFPFIPTGAIETSISNHWPLALPPLPWNDDPFTGKPMTPVVYQKYYMEWKGNICAIIPVINKLFCVANVFAPSMYADLYSYVPLANTVDHNAKNLITGVPIFGEGGTEIAKQKIQYNIVQEPVLYFPHTQEDSDLSHALNNTFQPKDSPGGLPIDQSVETNDANQCKTVNVRSNPGDYLFPEVKPSGVNVFVNSIAVTRVPCHQVTKSCSNYLQKIQIALGGNPQPCEPVIQSVCQGTVAIQIQMITKTPYADELWQNTVAGTDSTFRRIYPKVDDNAPVSCIADMPTVTNVTYTPTEGVQKGDFKVIGPNGENTTDNPQLFFPHIGSVYEYFLKGIQAALRPQGYAEQPYNGTDCKAVTCTGGGKALTLPAASGSCRLGKTSGLGSMTSVPPSLKQLLEAAGSTYNVPPSLLLAIMYGEGAFNPGKWSWTETNVKSWLTSCIRMPNCNPSASPTTGPIDFFPAEWNKVKDAIQKIDPSRKPDVCNLADMVFGLAKEMQTAQNGSAGLPNTCFGISLNKGSGGSASCSWDKSDIETAIKEWETGNTSACLTKEGSCATGGGLDATCPTGGDTCETVNHRYSSPSHNACLWDVTNNYK